MFKKIDPNYRMASSGRDGGCLTTVIERIEKDGLSHIVKRVGSSTDLIPELPSPDNFTLQAQLDAGVRLDYVDTNLLAPSEFKTQSQISQLNIQIENETSED